MDEFSCSPALQPKGVVPPRHREPNVYDCQITISGVENAIAKRLFVRSSAKTSRPSRVIDTSPDVRVYSTSRSAPNNLHA